MKFGIIPEIIGRLPVICTLEDLDENALLRILTEPRNAPVRQYQKLMEMDNVDSEFSDVESTFIDFTLTSCHCLKNWCYVKI